MGITWVHAVCIPFCLHHGVNAICVQVGKLHCPIQLGLPSTHTRSELHLHFALNGEMWDLPVATECAADDTALTCTVYVATHYLCLNPIVYTQAPEGSILQKDGNYEFHNFRVLEEDSKIINLYDSVCQPELLPNETLMDKLGLDAVTTPLSTDGRFTMLKYTKIQGDHNFPSALSGFKGIAQALETMHNLGYVHGDVRLWNMVFNHKTGESYMIDFDLSRLEADSPWYPKNYNFIDFPERQCYARSRCLMHKKA